MMAGPENKNCFLIDTVSFHHVQSFPQGNHQIASWTMTHSETPCLCRVISLEFVQTALILALFILPRQHQFLKCPFEFFEQVQAVDLRFSGPQQGYLRRVQLQDQRIQVTQLGNSQSTEFLTDGSRQGLGGEDQEISTYSFIKRG
jgi:hypothetical protein